MSEQDSEGHHRTVAQLGLEPGDRVRVDDKRGFTFLFEKVTEWSVHGKVLETKTGRSVDTFGGGTDMEIDMSKSEVLKRKED